MIKLKGIQHEILGDAPFIGARLLSCDCDLNCPGCFNKELRKAPVIEMSVEDIFKEIERDPFNRGIVLGGLEWSLQPDDMQKLVEGALERALKVMIYTGHSLEELLLRCPFLIDKPVYVKYGEYIASGISTLVRGVQLASSNQSIVYLGQQKS